MDDEITAIRRINLKAWVEKYKVPPKEKSLFSQLLGAGSFGERVARRLERDYGMGHRYLDSGANKAVDIYVSKDLERHIAIPSYIVPVFEAVASMGLGKPQPEADTVVDNIRLTKAWVDSHLPAISSPGNLAVLSAYGDSMAPTFADGDLLLVDRGVDSIKIDAVYVLALNGELYVKRIQRRITDGAVIIKSDNPLYDPVTVQNGDRDGLSVLGRVVWAWNGRKL